LIVPHAGYVYSGEVAALGFIRLGPAHERVRRVILIGPSHYADFEGLAATRARAFATPLGEVRVEEEALDELDGMPQVRVFEEAHGPEHALEVELPFLQAVLDEFSIVPLLVGRADAGEVGEVLDRLWGGPETCVVVSSDLSHYLDQTAARQKDRATAEAIMGLDTRALDATSACGYRAIAGLLEVVRARGLRGETIALRTSADAGGTRDRVVGYGAFAFETTEAQAAGRGR
jgi:AmmeMemoRadiSam system protein B